MTRITKRLAAVALAVPVFYLAVSSMPGGPALAMPERAAHQAQLTASYKPAAPSRSIAEAEAARAAGARAVRHHCTWRCYPRNRAMNWALRQAGCWYAWGGTDCSQGFDCSGLVMEAYASIGVDLPRTTYDMLADVGVKHYTRHFWWKIVETTRPKRGDLAFYGSGHVELDTKLHDTTFGAHDSGTRVGYARWGYGWAPTAFYRIEVHRRN